MKYELLEKANVLKEIIDGTRKIIDTLEGLNPSAIRAVEYLDNNEEITATILFSKGDELHQMILNYFICKLAEYHKEFDEL